jgi:Matrixin
MAFRLHPGVIALAQVVSAVLIVVFSTQPAHAFCRTNTCRDTATKKCRRDATGCIDEGIPVFWKSRCITFHLHRKGSSNLAVENSAKVIEKTFASWSDRTCPGGQSASLLFVRGEDVDLPEPREPTYVPNGSNLNVIFFRNDNWPYKGIDGTLATTSVNFDRDTGEIYDADIAVNSASNVVTIGTQQVVFDLESIMVHEAGHFVGLNHSDDPSALMYASYAQGSINRVLQEDDLKGLCNAYPTTRSAVCTTAQPGPDKNGCCAVAPNGRNSALTATLTGLGLCSIALLRRRRRNQCRLSAANSSGRK